MSKTIDDFDGRRCIGFTKIGSRCKNYRQYGYKYCSIHNNSGMEKTTCKGLTKKKLRCKRTGKVYCSLHQNLDWTGKSCTEIHCERIRTSPK